jgi:osmoprotectant transport system permease protein
MSELLRRFPDLFVAHVRIAGLALALGIVISLPLGIWASRRPRVERILLSIANIVQAIPGLAMLALMIPLYALIADTLPSSLGNHVPAIGFAPAVTALTLYSMLPILQNTIIGLRSVEPSLQEAALGVGMTSHQQLRHVLLPQAMPVIVAGIRTASVWVAGTATLATPIGANSLGNFIFGGLQTRNHGAVLLGSLGVAFLSIAVDTWIKGLENSLRTRSRAKTRLYVASLAFLCAILASAPLLRHAEPEGSTLRVGAKAFTEGAIMGEIMAQTVQAHASVRARVTSSLSSAVIFDALTQGGIDTYLDFSGTLWANVLKRRNVPPQPEELLRLLRSELLRKYDIEVVANLGYQNRYVLCMRRATAERFGIKTLSELGGHASSLRLGTDQEFPLRVEWKSLLEQYGLHFQATYAMEAPLMFDAIAHEQVDVIVAYSTDGRIASLDLVALDDIRNAMPPYHAIILMRGDVARRLPEVRASLATLDARFSDATVQALNLAVEQSGQSPASVAKVYLEHGGL